MDNNIDCSMRSIFRNTRYATQRPMGEMIMNTALKREAQAAARNAYCPYSNFRVGAAVLCEDGTIVRGCNVENASYGLTICAERNALFAAVALGKKPVELAVDCMDSAPSDPDILKTPCGACRQVMAEFYRTKL